MSKFIKAFYTVTKHELFDFMVAMYKREGLTRDEAYDKVYEYSMKMKAALKKESIDKTIRLLRKAYTRDTCYPGLSDKWSADNPTIGQCAITALLLQKKFGGRIVKNREFHHYFNIIDGRVVDATREQFSELKAISADEKAYSKVLLSNEDTRKRYNDLYSRYLVLLRQERVE